MSRSGSDSASSGGGISGEDETLDGRLTSVPAEGLGNLVRRGDQVGRFVVLERLGVGGMGSVYSAYDDRLDRKIALKVFQRGLRGKARARVIQEAQTMAKLAHPHVVQIYEVADHDGDLFLAMERVSGDALSAWQRAEGRTVAEVVDVYRKAGEGLAAAHAAGVVHRDFKPGNVMVSDDGQVKVLDFGLARRDDSTSSGDDEPRGPGRGTSSSNPRLTMEGDVMGTPAYMAPEQFQSADVGEAADQFAFCVSLWEGVCGQRPFGGLSLAELFGAARRGEFVEPPARRRIPSRLRGVLERGLAAKPEGRWPSMRVLLTRIDAATKTRHRVVGGALALGIVGVTSLGVFAIQSGRSQACSGGTELVAAVWNDDERSRLRNAFENTTVAYASTTWDKTQAQLDAYAAQWQDEHTEACAATTIRGEQSESVMDLRMACLHRAMLSLEATIDVLAHADPSIVEKAHVLVEGLPPVDDCSDLDALLADVSPPIPEEVDVVEDARRRLARIRADHRAARYESALKQVDDAEVVLGSVTYRPVRIELALARADALRDLADPSAAIEILQDALEQAAVVWHRPLMFAAARRLLAVVGSDQKRWDDAVAYGALTRGLARTDQERALVANAMGALFTGRGELSEAEREFRAANELYERLGQRPSVAQGRSNLASVLRQQGRLEDAEEEVRAALETYEQEFGPRHPRVSSAWLNLGSVLYDQLRNEEAESAIRHALEIRQEVLPDGHPDIARARANLANALMAQGRNEEALQMFRAAVRDLDAAFGERSVQGAPPRQNMANLLVLLGRVAEGEAELRRVRSIITGQLDPKHPMFVYSHTSLAEALEMQERWSEAAAEYADALELREQRLGPDHPKTADILWLYANALDNDERPQEALPLATRAWDIRKNSEDAAVRGSAALLLARAHWSANKGRPQRAEARRYAQLAVDAFREAGPSAQDDLREARSWLQEHSVGAASQPR